MVEKYNQNKLLIKKQKHRETLTFCDSMGGPGEY